MTRHLSSCAVVFWHFAVASTCRFRRVAQLSVTQMNIWKSMADGNLITHSKHQDYVDETVCYWNYIRFLSIIPSCKHADMMRACMHTYQACICIHRQHCFYWSSWFLLILWVEISSALAAKSMFSFPYLLISLFFLPSLFLQLLVSLSHRMSSSACLLKQIEIDHL